QSGLVRLLGPNDAGITLQTPPRMRGGVCTLLFLWKQLWRFFSCLLLTPSHLQLGRFLVLPHRLEQGDEAPSGLPGLWMLRAKGLFTHDQRLLIPASGFLMVALCLSQPRQVVHCLRRVRMLRSQRLLSNCQRPLVEGQRLLIVPLSLVKICQV